MLAAKLEGTNCTKIRTQPLAPVTQDGRDLILSTDETMHVRDCDAHASANKERNTHLLVVGG